MASLNGAALVAFDLSLAEIPIIAAFQISLPVKQQLNSYYNLRCLFVTKSATNWLVELA